MERAVVAVIRNDQSQILILERYADDRTFQGPCLPGGVVEKGESLMQALLREVREETGLSIAGIGPIETLQAQGPEGRKLELHGYSAYVSGGKLIKFPSQEHRSASWVAPSLALSLGGLGDATRLFISRVQWIVGNH